MNLKLKMFKKAIDIGYSISDRKSSIKFYKDFNKKIKLLENGKKYNNILVVYKKHNRKYRHVFKNTTVRNIKKNGLDTLLFNHNIHRPIINIELQIDENINKNNISHIIPLLKEYYINTNLNDIIYFNTEIPFNFQYYKIFIRTINKELSLSFDDLDNKTLDDFNKLLN